jgi:hypothetical protein
LFPGEHSDVPFHATDTDESFMITAQSFDFSDDNWEFCLVTPNGTHCGESRDEPQLFHHHEGGEIEQIIPASMGTSHELRNSGNSSRCSFYG